MIAYYLFKTKLEYIGFKSRTKYRMKSLRWHFEYTTIGLLISSFKDDFTWDKLFKFFGLLALSSVVLVTILSILF